MSKYKVESPPKTVKQSLLTGFLKSGKTTKRTKPPSADSTPIPDKKKSNPQDVERPSISVQIVEVDVHGNNDGLDGISSPTISTNSHAADTSSEPSSDQVYIPVSSRTDTSDRLTPTFIIPQSQSRCTPSLHQDPDCITIADDQDIINIDRSAEATPNRSAHKIQTPSSHQDPDCVNIDIADDPDRIDISAVGTPNRSAVKIHKHRFSEHHNTPILKFHLHLP